MRSLLPPLVFSLALCASSPAIEFTPESWNLKDAGVSEHLGRQALSGAASLKDVQFEDGIIEFDFAAAHPRLPAGVSFRVSGEGDFERLSFRSGRIQYAPSFQAIEGWQLYSGDDFTADVPLPENRWVHVRLEVLGSQARVFTAARPGRPWESHNGRTGERRTARLPSLGFLRTRVPRHLRGEKTLLLDATGPRRFCADFEYIPEKGLLLIPSLRDNRIHAYRYR